MFLYYNNALLLLLVVAFSLAWDIMLLLLLGVRSLLHGTLLLLLFVFFPLKQLRIFVVENACGWASKCTEKNERLHMQLFKALSLSLSLSACTCMQISYIPRKKKNHIFFVDNYRNTFVIRKYKNFNCCFDRNWMKCQY